MLGTQVGGGLCIKFDGRQVQVVALKQVAGKGPGARPDLQHTRVPSVPGQARGDAVRDALLLEEVLAEMLLGSDHDQLLSTTSSRVRKATKRPPKRPWVFAWSAGARSSR